MNTEHSYMQFGERRPLYTTTQVLDMLYAARVDAVRQPQDDTEAAIRRYVTTTADDDLLIDLEVAGARAIYERGAALIQEMKQYAAEH